MPASPPLEPSTVLVAYAESIVEGGRVLVVGSALSRLGRQLLERGASFVYLCDPDPARVAAAASRNTSKDIAYAALSEGALALREGAFDLGIVENLGSVGDIVGVLKSLERALSPKGVALVASANPDAKIHFLNPADPGSVALDYYSLYDAVAAEFRVVRMLGQTPFVGYAVVDFAPETEPEPAIDTGFVPRGSEEPEWFIALGARRRTSLDAFVIVQLGFKDAWAARLEAAEANEDAWRPRRPHRQPARALTHQVGAAVPAVAALEAELLKRDAWIGELEKRATTADARADATETELEELRDKAATEKALAEAELAEARTHGQALEAKLTELERTLEAARASAQEKTGELSVRDTEILTLRARHAELESELARLRTEAVTRERELASRLALAEASERELREASLLAADEDAGNEVARLEAQLVERSHALRKLEHDVKLAEQLGRELVLELEKARQEQASGATAAEAPAEPPPAAGSAELQGLRSKLDALAATSARQAADLAAAEWRVQDLEHRLELESAVGPQIGAND